MSIEEKVQPLPEVNILTFLTLNDVYETAKINSKGGLAEMSTLIKRERLAAKDDCERRHVLLTVNGDFMSASAAAFKHKGQHCIDVFHYMGVDMVVPGNHEFDFGDEVLEERIQESNFTWLCCNIVKKSDGSLFNGMVGTMIQQYGSVKIGFLGLCTKETPSISYPGEDTVFSDVIPAAQTAVKQLLADGAEVLVALTHLRLKEDTLLATRVPQLDLILGGHDHLPYTTMKGKTLIHKCGQNAYWLGRVDMRITVTTTADRRRVNVSYGWKMISNMDDTVRPDPECVELIRKWVPLEDELSASGVDMVLLSHDLDSRTAICRQQQCTFGCLVADSLREFFHTDIGVINGGFIRGDCMYERGSSFTTADLQRELPFPSGAVAIRIKGKDILHAFEQQLKTLPNPTGSFPQLSAACLRYDPSRKPGQRVLDVTVYDRKTQQMLPLQPEQEYTVACTSFMHGGGDGITALRNGTLISEEGLDLPVRDCVEAFLHGKPAISYGPNEVAERSVIL
eukprot:CAMPEP_0174239250 /NCGR_PEP_ID=MMETSP0417-20130205/13992_1 /TAXON_ID=242541 /ORGANISM="Mayorella sp, Strain BSH-02190019" /LENGTH=509 /DNA_ID=CAMNT_0015318173 /DNA_START=86 /DNA_END=1611 /DNA_ORIENTATION=-